MGRSRPYKNIKRDIINMKKAIALISGGLDSLLAAKVVMEQGIHVEGINFYSGFFGAGADLSLRNQTKTLQCNVSTAKPSECGSPQWIADQLGIKLHVVNVCEEFKAVMQQPRYGFGANLNPCLDCKVFIVTHALKWIQENHFDFIISGEVLGQRPMSQRRDTMAVVIRDSKVHDLLLRPLCAKLLAPTLPEREGWVDREKLYAMSGRGRKEQITLAKHFGFNEFPAPAGGCLLTVPQYAKRLQDLWDHKGNRNYSLTEINLLKVGRHIRPNNQFKLIVGREEAENNYLLTHASAMVSLHAIDFPGPIGLIDGIINQENLILAASIIARFGKGRDVPQVAIQINPPAGDAYTLNVTPLTAEQVLESWYVG